MLTAVVPPTLGGGGTLPSSVGDGDEASDSAVSAPSEPGILEPGLAEKLEEGPHGVIVHFEDRGALRLEDSAVPGLDILYRFQNIPAVYGVGDQAAVQTMAAGDAVTFVEDAWKPIEYHLDTATAASRAREVFDPSYDTPPIFQESEPSPPQLAPDGDPIDGEDVGIAVVDSGIDSTHPGLDDGKVARNFIATPAGTVEVTGSSETGEGHGTRMAGIAAGTGEGSTGIRDLRGAAPGATLYGFAVRAGADVDVVFGVPPGKSVTVQPAIAFDWILTHGEDQNPPVEIVLNGWSCDDNQCGDPDEAHLTLASELAEEGMLVVFPVGNDGGAGLRAITTEESRLPTPGVLGVASHDDEEVGDRSSCIDDDSSRGDAFDPSTWPDVAAPGDDIISPDSSTVASVAGQDPAGQQDYTLADGATSWAAAHAAGVAALVEQAHGGDLSGEELEYILELTAHEADPFTTGDGCPFEFVQADPANPWDPANFVAGHGLVDAMEAVELAEDFTDLPADDPPELEDIPADFTGQGPVVASGGESLYLDGESGFAAEAPEDSQPRVRVLEPDAPIVHTTEPFEETQSISAVNGEIWMGTPNEYVTIRCASELAIAEAFHIDGGTGEETLLGSHTHDDRYAAPGAPWLRDFPVVFEEETTFEPGDRLRFTISVTLEGGDCLGVPGQEKRLVYSEADDAPSRVKLSRATNDIRSDTFEACQVLELTEAVEQAGCAWVGGEREADPLNCQTPELLQGNVIATYEVEWFGPPGSRIVLTCGGATTSCEVPGDPGDPWARCQATSIGPSFATNSVCRYVTPSGEEVDGEGFCQLKKG